MSKGDSLTKEFTLHQSSLKKFVARFVAPKDVEDIVQDTYIRASQTDYQIHHPKSFLMKIARNLAFDHLKRSETKLCDSMHGEDGELSIEALDAIAAHDQTLNDAISNERFQIFCQAVQNLPPQCKRAFVLKKVYGYSQKEIAKEMDIGESAVEKHIANGLKKCRQFMKEAQV